MKLFTFLCLAVGALASRHHKIHDARIIGGTLVPASENKFMAAVEIRGALGLLPDYYACGAVILDAKTVLTAAYCIDAIRTARVRVRVGSLKRQQGGQLIQVDNIIKAPGYNGLRRYNNLAILKLSESITMGSQAGPIELGSINLSGTVTVSGWGVAGATDLLPSTDLRKTTVPVVDKVVCKNKFDLNFQDNMFCAAGQGQGACTSDEGGPAYLTDGGVEKLVGIISRADSFLNQCSNTDSPAIFMDLSYFQSFINANLEPTAP